MSYSTNKLLQNFSVLLFIGSIMPIDQYDQYIVKLEIYVEKIVKKFYNGSFKISMVKKSHPDKDKCRNDLSYESIWDEIKKSEHQVVFPFVNFDMPLFNYKPFKFDFSKMQLTTLDLDPNNNNNFMIFTDKTHRILINPSKAFEKKPKFSKNDIKVVAWSLKDLKNKAKLYTIHFSHCSQTMVIPKILQIEKDHWKEFLKYDIKKNNKFSKKETFYGQSFYLGFQPIKGPLENNIILSKSDDNLIVNSTPLYSVISTFKFKDVFKKTKPVKICFNDKAIITDKEKKRIQ